MSEYLDRYWGIGAGLIIGDAHCAPYEGGPLEKGLWWLIGRSNGRHRYTDDSQMAFDLARHLAKNGKIKQQELANEFAQSYRWSRGYGPSTVAVLRQINRGKSWRYAATHKFKDGSFGNGAAMRVAPLAVFLHQKVPQEEIQKWVTKSAEVTHPNQKAIDGAMAITLCLINALDGLDPATNVNLIVPAIKSPDFKSHLAQVRDWIHDGSGPTPKNAKRAIGAGTAAAESCPIAIYIALLRANGSIQDIINHSNTGGGDTDTIGAMAGAIWGAYNGFHAIPNELNLITEGVEEMKESITILRDMHPTSRFNERPPGSCH